MLYRFWAFAALLLFIASCSTTKNNRKGNNDVAVELDTIEIVASRDNPYRASAPLNFDLVHTKLEVSFDYAKQHLLGKATIKLKVHFYPQKELVLDAKQFDIHEVSVINKDGSFTNLNYTYDSLQLKITLNREYARNEELTVYIRYTAKPEERKIGGSDAINSDKGLFFINPTGTDSTKPVQIWTQGETESSSCWFPTIDKPNQKTTQEIYITHLKKYVSLSNGVLVSSTDNGDSTVTDYWRMNLPHAPYLFMMAVGEFEVTKANWRDVPVTYYVEKDYAPYAKQIFGNTPQMMEFFSQKLGFDYPWPKYAQVIVRDYVSGAMENTSATLHGEFLQRTPRERLDETYEDVISHELFHQWFGDLVTCESWSNIPLNESFATYGEYLWNEYKYGVEEADYKRYDNFEKYLEEALGKNEKLIRFYYNDREDMFDRHSYEKGGLILHYLRNIVGDEAFFKSLELYFKTNQFKPVEIHQLRLAFEQVTGKDLNWFFNQWFMEAGHPVLDFKYFYDADSVYVTIEQKHSIEEPLTYVLPMNVKVWYGDSAYTYPIELNKFVRTFSFPAKGVPDLIDADADRVVLCEKSEDKTIANYIFQYNHSAGYIQRYEALVALADSQKTNTEAKVALVSALNDRFYGLRRFAAQKLKAPFDNSDSVKATLANLVRTDSFSLVRAAAVKRLAKISTGSKYETVYEEAIGDSSYTVSAEALKALASANAAKALKIANGLENEKNQDIAAAVAEVYANEGDANYREFFRSKLKSSTGITKYYLFYYYANFLTRMDKAMVLSGIEDIVAEAQKDDSHFILGAGKGSLKRIAKIFEDKKKGLESDLSKAEGKTEKLELQEKIGDYDAIISAANDALAGLNKKTSGEEEQH
jgi:aminopeptidase N